MSDYKLVPMELIERAAIALERFANDTLAGRNSAHELRELLAAPPAVQREPVAWSGWGCQYPGKMPRLYGERRIAELNCDWENGDQVLHFTAAPQPAEQHPAPDVAGLIEKAEALSFSIAHDLTGREYKKISKPFAELQDALAAHRKGGES